MKLKLGQLREWMDELNRGEITFGKVVQNINEFFDQPDKPEWSEINAELKRAEQKHPNFPTDMFRQLAIMQEEAGEVTKAVLHYHYEKGTLDDVREELIQTAAMCLRMLKNLPAPPQKQQKP